MLVVGASKRAWNGGKRTEKVHKSDKKRGCFVYFYDSTGHFHSKRVTKIEYFYYKYIVKHHRLIICSSCRRKVLDYCPVCRADD